MVRQGDKKSSKVITEDQDQDSDKDEYDQLPSEFGKRIMEGSKKRQIQSLKGDAVKQQLKRY